MYDKFFDVSRKNMVNNQIITNKVVNPLIIDAFLSIQKEKFIPKIIFNIIMKKNIPIASIKNKF